MTRRNGRYTEQTQETFELARQLTKQFGRPYQIDLEQIWLALVKAEKGIAGSILREASVHEDSLWGQVKDYSPPDYTDIAFPFSTPTTDWIQLYSDEANSRGHVYITTGHMLSALLRQNHETTQQILKFFQLNPAKLLHSINQAFVEWNDYSDHPMIPPPMTLREHIAEFSESLVNWILQKLFPNLEI